MFIKKLSMVQEKTQTIPERLRSKRSKDDESFYTNGEKFCAQQNCFSQSIIRERKRQEDTLVGMNMIQKLFAHYFIKKLF